MKPIKREPSLGEIAFTAYFLTKAGKVRVLWRKLSAVERLSWLSAACAVEAKVWKDMQRGK